MFPFKPLLAVDWVDLIIFLIIVVSSLLGQLFKGNKPNRQKPKPARPRPKPRPPLERAPEMQVRRVGDAGGGRVQAEPAKTALEREIEEFLQRHRPGQPGQPGRAAEPAGRRPPAPPRRKPAPPKPRPAPAPPVRTLATAEPHVEPAMRTTLTPSIGGPVLGEQLDQADERLENRLHDVFDHGIGQLSVSGTQPQIAAGTDSAVWDQRRDQHPLLGQVTQIMSDPQHVQLAIVLTEILRRPDERWS